MTQAPRGGGAGSVTPNLGVYVHWPYCARICPYCDFNVTRDRGQTREQLELADAIIDDLSSYASLTGPRTLVSIFLGGGTPSLMPPELAGRLILTARSLWTPAPELEVTLEANPTDGESARFAAFAGVGVNRLSLGLQSLDDVSLRFLGRNHDAATGRRAALRAIEVFPRLSVDLIYALPNQTPDAWRASLSEVIALGPEHISPYQLTIEPRTAFERSVRRGTLTPPDADRAADLFETTQSVLEAAGFTAYEVSNHARLEAAKSRHNLVYWRGEDYVGVGPGAHGRLTLSKGRVATTTPRSARDYSKQTQTFGRSAQIEPLNAREVALERLLMGLRTNEGVEVSELAPLNIDREILADFGDLLHLAQNRVTVPPRSRVVLDKIISILARRG